MVNFKVSVDEAVKEVSKIVSGIAGIQLGEKQYSMVESRLKSRMSKLSLNTSDEYLAYLKNHEESETEALLSLMTTHHTYFFREFSHFEHILNNHLKNLIAEAEKRGDKKIRIWSAACSRGQEAYSLAMFFDFHLKHLAPHIDFEIWGTDIDPESVEIAKNGVYKTEELNRSPAMYVGQHWVQGKNHVKEYSKVKD
ncbi:MAG: CheR family methyltransferase, partial [Pseudobdellovibrio sp.]